MPAAAAMPLTDGQREVLERLGVSRTAPFREVQRAQALLLAADNVANAWRPPWLPQRSPSSARSAWPPCSPPSPPRRADPDTGGPETAWPQTCGPARTAEHTRPL